MKLILPDNRNVTPVILPCVGKKIQEIHTVNVQDNVSHDEVLEGEQAVRTWFSHWIDTDQFPCAYYMGDGITKAIDLTRLEYNEPWGLLNGDYEWPMAYGESRRKRSITQLLESINYLTQPFAGTGALWSQQELESTQGKLVLDLAYISTCKPEVIKLSENVDRIFIGASKSLGTSFLRHGWMLSKNPIPVLDMFFKSIRYFSSFGFRAGIHLYKTVNPLELSQQGFYYRDKIVHSNPEYDLKGDSWLIAHTEKELPLHLKRGNVYRIPLGLTIKQMIL